ncbi:MAG: ammonia-forming cytochrome c nitrite reductase [Bacteroidales bacterium]|nr:ammonia-forming cytochrome c nitrite reductase [Bacteroidales bacterium]
MGEKKMKSWHGWTLFAVCMVVVFVLGLLASSLMERRAETASVFNNRQVKFNDTIEGRNDKFKTDFPREYETWAKTAETTFKSEFNSSEAVDVLEQRPEMVILWAGYAFSWDYTTPRGHMHAIEDMTRTLRTGAPTTTTDGSNQPGTCWTCKSPDVPRIMAEKGVSEYYKANWAMWGNEIVNPIGCADCHDPRTMELHISRPALREAFARQGKDINKATHQEMRTLVCAQCHVEYYFKDDPNTPEHDQYLTFPWDKGLTVEDIEAYYDESGYYDYIHALSKTPILKAQHPGYETTRMGIHGQRGVSCADCHMPYTKDGGVKYSDHQVQSPLAKMDRTCLTCHRESEETLRENVYERQRKCNEIRNNLEKELATAHIEAKFAWDNGATEAEMKPVLDLIRKSQWRWDFAVASHGAAFHAPQEIARILSGGLYNAQQARLAISKVLAKHGFTGDVPMPDISTKEKAQEYIGIDIKDKEMKKSEFMKNIQPQWIEDARSKGKIL